MRERQTIPTKGPDTHVPSTPLVQDITNRGEYHRIRTVWLKSQADETLPSTPIGRTPEEREIADTQFSGQADTSSHPVLGQPSTPPILSCSGERLTSLTKVRFHFIRPHEYQPGPHTGPRVLPINGSHERSNANWPPILCTNWRSPGEF